MKKLAKYTCLFAFSISILLFSACSSIIPMTINFNSNGGTECQSIKYNIGNSINMPNEPTKEGYIFDGWYVDNEEWKEPLTINIILNYPLTNNNGITAYAKWLNKIHIIFDSNDGSDCTSLFLDSLSLSLPIPTKENYEFKGWYLDNTTFNNVYTIDKEVSPNNDNAITVYAKWEENVVKTIYYSSALEIDKEYDVIQPNNSISLYTPSITGKIFVGWFYDNNFENQAPNTISNSMVTSYNRTITLYAKWIEKEVFKLSIIGSIQTEYEYGEELNINGAKLKIEYLDKNYADETIDITKSMISNFYTKDEFFQSNYDSSLTDSIKQQFSISVNSKYLYVDYYVNSDIENLTVNAENLIFNHGEKTYFKDRNIVASWTDLNHNIGTTQLTETANYGINYYIQKKTTWDIHILSISEYSLVIGEPAYRDNNLNVENYGTYTATLRYHYKTIEVQYVVEANENIVNGSVKTNEWNNIYLDEILSLQNRIIILKDSLGNEIKWSNFSSNLIVLDIDTSTSGQKTAKINYNDKEIDISYYVIDTSKIVSAKAYGSYYNQTLNSTPSSSFKAEFKLEDGTIFQEFFNHNDIIQDFDTSSVGKKFATVLFNSVEYQIEYNVVN